MTADTEALQTAGHGFGPLLQRDFWAVLQGCHLSAPEVAQTVAQHFERFAPPDLVEFERREGSGTLLTPGDDMDVHIRMAGSFRVRVVHRDDASLTIATVHGHPEAGRITFGAYPNGRGEIVFHIRSRARSGSRRFRLGFPAIGEPMQTNTWSGYINRLAASVSDGVRDVVHARTREVEETEDDRRDEGIGPTFRANASETRSDRTSTS